MSDESPLNQWWPTMAFDVSHEDEIMGLYPLQCNKLVSWEPRGHR